MFSWLALLALVLERAVFRWVTGLGWLSLSLGGGGATAPKSREASEGVGAAKREDACNADANKAPNESVASILEDPEKTIFVADCKLCDKTSLGARCGSPWTLRGSRARDTHDPGLPILGCQPRVGNPGSRVARFGPGSDLRFSRWVWFRCSSRPKSASGHLYAKDICAPCATARAGAHTRPSDSRRLRPR